MEVDAEIERGKNKSSKKRKREEVEEEQEEEEEVDEVGEAGRLGSMVAGYLSELNRCCFILKKNSKLLVKLGS